MMLADWGRKRFVVTAVVALVAVAGSVQAGWLQKGKDLLFGSGQKGTQQAKPSQQDVTAAFKQALRQGAQEVVAQLGQKNGFYQDEAVHIPLPDTLKRVQQALDKANMGFLTQQLEEKLNRAAEQVTPKAKELFFEAVSSMSFKDVMAIYKGPEDAATQYFKQQMATPLAKEMEPIIADSMSQVGAVQTYDQVMNKYTSLPFVPDVKANLTDYVTQKAMDGIFYYMAQEEAAIRENPAKQTTALLRRVFGK